MGVFILFKKRKAELTDKQKKWNRMWDLWVEGRAVSLCGIDDLSK